MDIFLTYVTFYYERVTFDSYLTKYKSECFVCDDELDMTTIYSIQIKTYFHQHPLLKTTFSSWQIQYSFEHRKRRKVAKMSLNQFVSILVVFCLHTSYCGVPSFGSCPSLSGISDFSVYPSQIQRREGVRLSNLNTQIVVIIISYSIRIEFFYSSNVFLTTMSRSPTEAALNVAN